MKKLLLSLLAMGALLGWSRPSPAQELKPLLVVSLSSYDELMQDVGYLSNLVGQPNRKNEIEAMVNAFVGGLPGLDKSKPIGGVVMTDGATFPRMVFLPVTDLDKLLGALAGVIGTPKDQGGGVWEIEVQNMPLFIKAENGYAYLAQSTEDLASAPKDPGALVTGLQKDYDVAVRVHMQNIPEVYKQLATGLIQQGLEGGLQQNPNESDADFANRKKFAQQQMEQMVRSINDMDQLTLGFALDRQAKKTYVDFGMTAVAESVSAKQLAGLQNPTTQFSGFTQPGAVFSMSASSKILEADIAQSTTTISTVREQVLKQLDESTEFPNEEAKAAAKELLNDMLKLSESIIKSGKADVGISLMGNGPFTIVAGMGVGSEANVPELVDKLVGFIKREGHLADFKRNAATTPSGVAMHRIAIKAPTGPETEAVEKFFGQGNIELIVGTTKSEAYFAIGADALKSLESCIAKSVAAPNSPTLPMQMSLALAPILKMAAQAPDADPKLPAMAAALEQSLQDHLRLFYRPIPQGVQMRLEAEEGIIKVLGSAGAATAAGAGRSPAF